MFLCQRFGFVGGVGRSLVFRRRIVLIATGSERKSAGLEGSRGGSRRVVSACVVETLTVGSIFASCVVTRDLLKMLKLVLSARRSS